MQARRPTGSRRSSAHSRRHGHAGLSPGASGVRATGLLSLPRGGDAKGWAPGGDSAPLLDSAAVPLLEEAGARDALGFGEAQTTPPPGATLDAPPRVAGLRQFRIALQFVVTGALLALLWRVSGGAAMRERLGRADPAWVAAGLAFATGAMVVGSLRWRYTARRLGSALSLRHAMREFYLATFLNQVLPGGVGGDAVRAYRHGKSEGGLGALRGGAAPVEPSGQVGVGAALRAVVVEKVASHIVMATCVTGSMALWPWVPGASSARHVWGPLAAAVAAVTALGALAFFVRRGGRLESFLRDARRALLNRASLFAQLGLGVLLLAHCLALFYCASRAIGAPVSLFHLLALVPPSLFAMSIPVSVGGWGLREASVVALWAMAGLPAAEGMASSVLFGGLTLVSTLPGAAVLLADR